MEESIQEIELMADPLLTFDDQKRIIDSKEFDDSLELPQWNQEISEDDENILELILEEETESQKHTNEQDFKMFCKFLTDDYLGGLETRDQCKGTSTNDFSFEFEDDFEKNREQEQPTICSETETHKEESTPSKTSKFEINGIQKIGSNERNLNLNTRTPSLKKKSSKRFSKKRSSMDNDKIKLDEFLMMLLNDDTYSSFIHWTYKERKEFKLVNPGQVSNLWGNLKGKRKFTSDKLLREMRHLRSSGVMNKLERKDHFKFS